MFMLPIDHVLSPEELSKVLKQHSTDSARLKKLENYYLGKSEILNRSVIDSTKPNNKLVTNFSKLIVDSFTSYMVGIPVKYSSNTLTDELTSIIEVLEYNDAADQDIELLTDTNTFGIAYELMYVDEESRIRFKKLSSLNTLVILDDTLEQEPLYGIRYYANNSPLEDSDTWTVEVYSKVDVQVYKTTADFGTLDLTDNYEHHFQMCPIHYAVNDEYMQGSFETVLSLIDAYDKLTSDEVNDFESFVDAYMVLKNLSGTTTDDIIKMKENRILLLDGDSDASYLTKDVNDTQVQNIKKDIVENIHKISCSVDTSDKEFGTSSGIAIRYKLLSMENLTAKKERKYKKFLQRRIELICSILSAYNTELNYNDIDIRFTRNLPVNGQEMAQQVNLLRGLVSDETLIGMVPGIDDIQGEVEKIKQQKADTMYLFGGDNPTNETTPVTPSKVTDPIPVKNDE